MNPDHIAIKEMVRHILDNPSTVVWSLQGFGMLRCYIDSKEPHMVRLNIYNSKYKVRGVSTIHNHPWFFTSHIVVGKLYNIKYHEFPNRGSGTTRYNHVKIVCGPGAHPADMNSQIDTRSIAKTKTIILKEGDHYSMDFDEIHETDYEDGTVTINVRDLKNQNNEADVYWLTGPWVSAEPRMATSLEVHDFITSALKLF